MQHDFRKPKRVDIASASVPHAAGSSHPEVHKQPNKRIGFLKRRWKLIALALVVILVGALGYGYVTTRNQLTKLSNPGAAAEVEAKNLATEVGRFLELPPEETPTLATVSDASLLKEQAFFSRAENGDRVLVYSKAQRAVLYRPSTKRVIEYAPVSLGAQP